MGKNDFQAKTGAEREFKKVFETINYAKNRYEVFCDWCLCSALSFSQVCHFDENREKRYLEIVKKYSKEDLQKFAELLAITTKAFMIGNNPYFQDFLGNIYMICGFGSSTQGQFFTPYSVCQAMAQMQGIPEKNKIITVMDCAVGGGALPIAYAEHLYKNGINYQMNMLLHATDISINSCAMCMVQCSLLGIPAIIVHGNSLTLETWEVWETPMVGINLVTERLEAQKRNGVQKITTEKIIENTSQNKEIIKNTSQNEVKKIIESKQLEFSF